MPTQVRWKNLHSEYYAKLHSLILAHFTTPSKSNAQWEVLKSCSVLFKTKKKLNYAMFYLVGCCSYRGRSEIKCPVIGPERLKAIILTAKFIFVCSSFSFAAGSHNDRIMLMSDTVSSEGPKTTGIQQSSSAMSLTLRDFSESFDDFLDFRGWDLQSLCNLTLRNVVFKVFHNLFMHSFTDWRASTHLYFWQTLLL